MRVCVVVVTYNRKHLLARCLKALLAQSQPADKILVVDNASSDGTADLVREEFPQVELYQLSENLGGSGGFHAGMQHAHEQGFDWLWVMDDDALPLRTALACLLPHMEAKVMALASTLIQDDRQAEPCTEVRRAIPKTLFVGFAVSKQALDVVGYPRADFFIYSDDSEFCLRIRKAGGELWQVASSQIQHADWLLSKDNISVSLGGRRITLYPIMPAWKKYYLARNRILVGRVHSFALWLKGVMQATVLLLLTLIFAPNDAALVARGLWHGLSGRAGITVRP